MALFVTLAQLDSNLSRELRQNLPQKALAFFFMDIQPDALDPFRTTAKSVPSVETIETVPMLRGRIVKVKAITAKDVTPSSKDRLGSAG